MKKLFLLAAILMAVMPVAAANVDVLTALATAERFAQTRAHSAKFSSSSSSNIRLLRAEPNTSRADLVAYYIFNTDKGFIIVAGDDRAQEILAYGDRSLDLNRLPANMKFWLETCKRQIEFLQAHPGLAVEKPKMKNSFKTHTIPPLLTAEWDQLAPYYNQCPVYQGEYCLTGCPATSLSMVFYFWKYPTAPTPEVDSFYSLGCGMQLPALPSVTFDWDNMLDTYVEGQYTDVQADAVATLMRYVGQEEKMDYSPEGSGADGEDILRAVKFFGYDESAELVYKSVADAFGVETELINDDDWAVMLQNELIEGRPVVYCAYDYSSSSGWSGHAFNVDGYTASDNTYHVNWGWSGEGNGNYALNAFSYGNYSFDVEQMMIMGIQPPVTTPTIRASSYQLDMDTYVDQNATSIVTVLGKELIGDITLTLNDESGYFSLDASSVTVDESTDGKAITVTYSPLSSGTHSASVTMSSPDAEDVTILLNGVATLETFVPEMLPVDSNYISLTSFRADWQDQTLAKYVQSYTLEVNTTPGTYIVGEADWSDMTESSTNYSNNPGSLMPEGWTFTGSGLWREAGGISISKKSAISSPFYDLAGFDRVTVVVTARSATNNSSSRFMVSTSIDSVECTVSGGSTFTTQTVVLDCDELDQVTITGKSSYPVFQNIKVYGGELDVNQLRAAVEEGDENYRLITDITSGTSHTIENLTPGGSFYYRVKALYIDGTQSRWSKSKQVTLYGDDHGYASGDVNHDGMIDVSDVTALIGQVLGGESACPVCSDVNGDGAIDVSDVTALIGIVLGGS